MLFFFQKKMQMPKNYFADFVRNWLGAGVLSHGIRADCIFWINSKVTQRRLPLSFLMTMIMQYDHHQMLYDHHYIESGLIKNGLLDPLLFCC